MNSILYDQGVRNRNIKILTLDPFVKEFIEGNREYADIQIVKDLSKAIDSLLKDVRITSYNVCYTKLLRGS